MYRSFDKPYPDISRSSLLITGGTGSFGRAFVRELLRKHPPQRLVVFSRDEQKQEEMAHELRAAFPQHFDRSCASSSATCATSRASNWRCATSTS